MPNTEFKNGPTYHFIMCKCGELIPIHDPQPKTDGISFEITAIDDHTISIAPPSKNACSN